MNKKKKMVEMIELKLDEIEQMFCEDEGILSKYSEVTKDTILDWLVEKGYYHDIQKLYMVEYYSDETDLSHTTFELFKSYENAKGFTKGLGENAIHIASADFDMRCVWIEDNHLQYNDVSELYDLNSMEILKEFKLKIISDREDFIEELLGTFREDVVREYATEHFENLLSIEENIDKFQEWIVK